MALVDQHVTLFPTSVLENIRYGRPEASDEEVEAAAKAAEADAFIRSFLDGYATLVGEAVTACLEASGNDWPWPERC